MPLLCVASPKGGVGKTTLAANLAWELARAGKQVMALDLDPQNALRLHFGMKLQNGHGVMPILRQERHWKLALQQTPSSVLLLPHGRVDIQAALTLAEMMRLDPGLVARMIEEILVDAKTILIVDTPPGPSAALSAILPITDFLVTVMLADATSVALIPAVKDGSAYGRGNVAGLQERHGFVLNQVNLLSRLSRATTDAVSSHLGKQLLGTISRDETVAEAIACQQSVSGYRPVSRAAQDIALLSSTIDERLTAIAAMSTAYAETRRGYAGLAS
jgi:cellulose synthase operon protein YhjQ